MNAATLAGSPLAVFLGNAILAMGPLAGSEAIATLSPGGKFAVFTTAMLAEASTPAAPGVASVTTGVFSTIYAT